MGTVDGMPFVSIDAQLEKSLRNRIIVYFNY
jgi:hypothetical protein